MVSKEERDLLNDSMAESGTSYIEGIFNSENRLFDRSRVIYPGTLLLCALSVAFLLLESIKLQIVDS